MVDIKNPHVLDQMTRMQPLLLLLTLIVEVSCLKPTKLVTCEASASALGQPANVTCSFHKVLDDPNTEIMVVHHPLGAAKGDLGKDVLVCFRSENADNPYCIARDGYLFNGNISNRLTLEIPEATPECAGEYSCQIIPPDGIVIQSCNLSVQDSAVTPTVTENYINGPTDAGGSPCPQTDGCYAETTALTTVLVGMAILLIIAAIVIVRLWGRLRNRNTHAETDPQSREPCITPTNPQCQISFLSKTVSCPAGLLVEPTTTDDTEDTDFTTLQSLRILTTSDTDLTGQKEESVPGNIFDRHKFGETKKKSSLNGPNRYRTNQATVSTKDTELVAQPEENRKDR